MRDKDFGVRRLQGDATLWMGIRDSKLIQPKGLCVRGVAFPFRASASYLDSHFIVQLESDYCRSAYGRKSNDLRTIGTPAKVLVPIIRARIVERHHISGE
jgi:hypothetical protein